MQKDGRVMVSHRVWMTLRNPYSFHLWYDSTDNVFAVIDDLISFIILLLRLWYLSCVCIQMSQWTGQNILYFEVGLDTREHRPPWRSWGSACLFIRCILSNTPYPRSWFLSSSASSVLPSFFQCITKPSPGSRERWKRTWIIFPNMLGKEAQMNACLIARHLCRNGIRPFGIFKIKFVSFGRRP